MKKATRILSTLIAFIVMIAAMQIIVSAENVNNNYTLIRTKSDLFEWCYAGFNVKKPDGTLRTKELTKGKLLQWCATENSVKSLKSSNTSVATVQMCENYAYYLKVKKAGKATVSYTCKQYEKTLKVKDTYTIYDYKNPLKSFKIGSKELASKFKSSPFCPSKTTYSGKLNVKLNSGWKLVKIRQAGEGSTLMALGMRNMKTLKNGAKVSTKKGPIEVIVYNKSKKYYTSVIFGAGKNSNLIYG